MRRPWPKALTKRVTTRVIFPGVRRAEKTHLSPKGQAWTAGGEQKLLEAQAELLETKYPDFEWRMVEVEPHVFNFIGEKKKEAAA